LGLVTLNYVYCDIITVMDPEIFKDLTTAHMGDLEVTQGFLLGAGILVEIPIAMTILSRVLDGGARRWTNVAAGRGGPETGWTQVRPGGSRS
jgi:hypothetical protein